MADTANPSRAIAVNDDAEEPVFDFFGLPRELRNEIYSMLHHNEVLLSGHNEKGDPRAIHVAIENTTIPNLLTLNQQFKVEYQEMFKRGPKLLFKDVGAFIKPPEMPNILRLPGYNDISRAEILLLVTCTRSDCDGYFECQAFCDVSNHIEWIKEVVPQLEKLEELDIKVYQCQYGVPTDKWIHPQMLMVENFTTFDILPQASRVTIYLFISVQEQGGSSDSRFAIKAYEVESEPIAFWTKSSGWQN